MSEKFYGNLDKDFTKSDEVIAAMRILSNRLIRITQVETNTKEAAIDQLTDTYNLGTFLKRLHRGDKVSDSMSMFFRLGRALQDAIESQREKLAQDETVLEDMGICRRPRASDDGTDRDIGEAGCHQG